LKKVGLNYMNVYSTSLNEGNILREIRELKPSVILLLGKVILNLVLPEIAGRPFRELRSKVFRVGELPPVVVGYSFGFILRDKKREKYMDEDFATLRRVYNCEEKNNG